MGKGDNKLILEEACRRLTGDTTRGRAISYTAVKNMMAAVRSDQDLRPATTPAPSGHQKATAAPRWTGDRGGLLGGASQFSLDALTGATTSTDQEDQK